MPDVLMSADGIKQLKAEIDRLMAEFERLREVRASRQKNPES
jgi:hypothetical protein